MSLEQAVRRLTFESASTFGIYDRGLLRPGMAADMTIFDADTVQPLPEDVVHDFPAGGWRIRELAEGIHYTIVNGQVLLEDGRHTGALPGRVLRNALCQTSQTTCEVSALVGKGESQHGGVASPRHPMGMQRCPLSYNTM